MRLNRRAILSGTIAAASSWLSVAATAQTAFPAKPITIIVPAAAGGPTDTVARLIAESMGRTLGQTILIENVGGAGGTLGMTRVSKSVPDGYTLAVWHIAHATAPALYDSIKYDVVNDFDHLGRITDVPMTLVSKSTLAANDAFLDLVGGVGGLVAHHVELAAEQDCRSPSGRAEGPQGHRAVCEPRRWGAVIKAAGAKGN